jgi:hypothetical protein
MGTRAFAAVNLFFERIHCGYVNCPQNKNAGGDYHPMLDWDAVNYGLTDQPIAELSHSAKYIG